MVLHSAAGGLSKVFVRNGKIETEQDRDRAG